MPYFLEIKLPGEARQIQLRRFSNLVIDLGDHGFPSVDLSAIQRVSIVTRAESGRANFEMISFTFQLTSCKYEMVLGSNNWNPITGTDQYEIELEADGCPSP